MTRPAAAPEAGRNDSIHGDEPWGLEFTAAEQVAIERRADEIVAERLYESRIDFEDIMAGLDARVYYDGLQDALKHLDAACKGDLVALNAITAALHQIQRVVKPYAVKLWGEQATEAAELEQLGRAI